MLWTRWTLLTSRWSRRWKIRRRLSNLLSKLFVLWKECRQVGLGRGTSPCAFVNQLIKLIKKLIDHCASCSAPPLYRDYPSLGKNKSIFGIRSACQKVFNLPKSWIPRDLMRHQLTYEPSTLTNPPTHPSVSLFVHPPSMIWWIPHLPFKRLDLKEHSFISLPQLCLMPKV